MTRFTRFTSAAARLGLLGLIVAGSACAGSPTPSVSQRFLATLDSLGYDTVHTQAPRVAVSSEADQLYSRRIIPRLHVADDAYVAVVNVWPSGEASVVFPESPEDDGFLAGGRTYVMSSVFSGFATMFPPAGAQGLRYVRFARSSDARIGARGPGYLVLVASRTPLDLAALDTAGLFDGVELLTNVREMEPAAVAPWIALLASGGNPAVAIDYARYGGYDAMSFASSASSSTFASRSARQCGLGYYGSPAMYAWDAEFGAAGCGFLGYDRPLIVQRFVPRPPVFGRDSIKGPADTVHVPTVRSAEVQAAWAALLREREARRPVQSQAAGDEADMPRLRDRHALDDIGTDGARRGRTGEDRARVGYRDETSPARARPRAEDGGSRHTPERPRAEPAPRRADPPAPRAEPVRPRAEPAPQRTETAPRQRPAEDPRPEPRS